LGIRVTPIFVCDPIFCFQWPNTEVVPSSKNQTKKMSRVLHTIVFIGSARDSSPPWGGDKRLGDRVVNHVLAALRNRSQVVGPALRPTLCERERGC
jgi:hypothetical protein